MRVVRSAEVELPVLRELIKDLAEYYFTTVTDKQVEMYSQDLLSMGSDLAREAALKYRKRFSNTKFPLPADLKKTVYFFEMEEEDILQQTG